MRKVSTRIILLIFLVIGITTSAQSQDPQRSYAISGQQIRTDYDAAIKKLNMGDYVSAYYHLSFYYGVNLYSGTFNQNPQFKQQVEQELQKLGSYLAQAVAERESLQRDLQACKRSAQSGVSRRQSGLTVPQIQLPTVPPIH
jgi:hypothetical protein